MDLVHIHVVFVHEVLVSVVLVILHLETFIKRRYSAKQACFTYLEGLTV